MTDKTANRVRQMVDDSRNEGQVEASHPDVDG